MSAFWFDLRYTLRLLGRSPAFAGLSVLVISLALALALTIYVLVRNQGIEPLPLPKGERYVALQQVLQSSGIGMRGDQFRAHTLQALQARNKSFELLGGARFHGSITVNDGDITEAPWGTDISPELLQATGVQPLLGRGLRAEDAEPGSPAVVLVGYQLWQNFFAGREDVVGHRVRVGGELHSVVGVMPEGFRYPTDHHLWRPLKLPPNSPPGDHSQLVTPVAILKPGVNIDEASREVAQIVADLQREHPEHYENRSARAIPYIYSASATDFTTMNVVMLAAGCSILLLACLNVGNLLLVRASERSQELVVRSALGGTRGRIIRQVLLESLLISLLGGGLGLWLGSYGARLVQYQTEVVIGSTYLPFWMRFDIGPEIFVLSAAAILLIWMLAGGIPAWRASRAQINTALGGGSKGVTSRGSSKMSGALVASEVVFSFFLLILSGLFIASVNLAAGVDFGVPTENTVAGMVGFDMQRYEESTQRLQYFENIVEELEREPGVAAATYATVLPGMGWWTAEFDIAEFDFQQSGELPRTQTIPVAPDYFSVLGVELLEGRHFETTDTAASMDVAIIDEDMAKRFWPGGSALGKQITINPEKLEGRPPYRELTVVGVVAHIDQGQALGRSRGRLNLYQPMAQFTPGFGYVVVRFVQQPATFEHLIQSVGTRVDRDIAIGMLRPLDVSMSLNVRILQTLSELFVIVALVAFVLAGTGIYGVVSRSVLLRTREMGIRRALGQTDRQTVRFFLRQGSLFLLAGVVLGGGGAVLAAWLLTSEFPNLLDSIAIVVIIISAVMTLLVLGASYLPARKMVGMEPAVALHYE